MKSFFTILSAPVAIFSGASLLCAADNSIDIKAYPQRYVAFLSAKYDSLRTYSRNGEVYAF